MLRRHHSNCSVLEKGEEGVNGNTRKGMLGKRCAYTGREIMTMKLEDYVMLSKGGESELQS